MITEVQLLCAAVPALAAYPKEVAAGVEMVVLNVWQEQG